MRFTLLLSFVIAYAIPSFAQPDLSTPEDCVRSIVIYNQKIQENPKNTYAYYVLATAHFRLQDQENIHEAIKLWDKLILLDETYKGAYYQRGYCKLFLEDYDGACADWKRSVELGYNPAEGYNRKSLAEGVRTLCGESVERMQLKDITTKGQ